MTLGILILVGAIAEFALIAGRWIMHRAPDGPTALKVIIAVVVVAVMGMWIRRTRRRQAQPNSASLGSSIPK
jgi:MFS superfamily sulfate permease-like transporter